MAFVLLNSRLSPAKRASRCAYGKDFLYLYVFQRLMLSDEELLKRAEKIAKEKADFYVHFSAYVLVNLMFIVAWLPAGGFPWWIFTLFGWGIGVMAHFVGTFVLPELRDNMVEKEYRKLKGRL